MKKVKLIREKYGLMSTLGKVYVNNEFVCYSLEDAVRGRGIKIPGFTAIPEGEYEGRWRHSPSFGRECLCVYTETDRETLVMNGVSFKYVMFHGGNDHGDSEGCPLIAHNLIKDQVASDYSDYDQQEFVIQGNAEAALKEAIGDDEEISITVINK